MKPKTTEIVCRTIFECIPLKAGLHEDPKKLPDCVFKYSYFIGASLRECWCPFLRSPAVPKRCSLGSFSAERGFGGRFGVETHVRPRTGRVQVGSDSEQSAAQFVRATCATRSLKFN